MIDPVFWTIERAAGLMLVLGNVVLFPGLMMFWIRGGHRGGKPPRESSRDGIRGSSSVIGMRDDSRQSPAFYVWERGLIMAAVVFTAIGFVLLDGQLQNTAGSILARTGATAYLFGGILGVAAEALGLTRKDESFYPLIVIYVVLAFLAQAATGARCSKPGC